MSKTVLFSPIGETDPIRKNRDGSMLHICRVYKPDVVYLYLSKEMVKHKKEDNRYEFAIEKLGQMLNHHFKVVTFERSDLDAPHEYGVFYNEFHEIISNIEKTMEEGDKLLLNMASGTPAMKSALLVLATFEENRFQVIQVESPSHRSNTESVNYDVIGEWEKNEDNVTELFQNRCIEEKCLQLTRLLKISMIKKHISAYDYPAALSIANDLEPKLNAEVLMELEAANERMKLNWTKVEHLIGKEKMNQWFPVGEQSQEIEQKLFEYALVLKIKVKKEEYADFLRGITPLVTDLFELILKRIAHIDVNDYCSIRSDEIRVWDSKILKKDENEKIKETLDSWFEKQGKGKFRPGQPVYAGSMEPLIAAFCSEDGEMVEKVTEISNVAGAVRNMAAHEIVSVTNDWFKDNTKKTAQDIMNILQYLVKKAGIVTDQEAWDAYDQMNDAIMLKL